MLDKLARLLNGHAIVSTLLLGHLGGDAIEFGASAFATDVLSERQVLVTMNVRHNLGLVNGLGVNIQFAVRAAQSWTRLANEALLTTCLPTFG